MTIKINSDLDIQTISGIVSTNNFNGFLTAIYTVPCYQATISLVKSTKNELFLGFKFFNHSLKNFHVKWIFPEKRFIVEAHKFGIEGNGRIGLCSSYLKWPNRFGLHEEYEFIEQLLNLVIDNDFIKHRYGLR